MTRFPVSSEKEASLLRRLATLGVREEDLVERFVRAAGPGGQNVNKTSTAVQLRHAPSGIEVKAQSARSQGLNRYLARQRLAEELEARRQGEASARARAVFKIRKQKRRRSRRAQEKVLSAKHHQAEKKARRGKPPHTE